ncbi:MAG TPA: PKD domain-containing protein, partial [Saprospiraceae bacterium]|nr:PKD domain-containing protein [Saprospiraceae bacterium]
TVAGTPDVTGSSTFTVEVRSADGQVASRTVTAIVDPTPALQFLSSGPPNGVVGVRYYFHDAICNPNCFSNGGGHPYFWTVTGGTILSGDGTHTIVVQWGAGPTGTIHLDYGSDFLQGLPGHDGDNCQGDADLTVSIKPEFSVSGAQGPFCTGSQSSFFATSFPSANYNWTITPAAPFSGNGTDNITVTWPAPGAYIIAATPATSGIYCNNTASTQAIVVDVPPADSITGPLEICPDDIATYYAHSAQGNIKYVWTVSGGTPSSFTGNPITVDWNPAGSYSLSVQIMQVGTPFCMSAPLTVPIQSKSLTGPVTITGTGACVNKQENYTASLVQSHPDAVYTWSVSPGTAGSVAGGQGTSAATIQWNNSGGPAVVNVMVKLCNQTLNGSLPVNIGNPMVSITQSGTLCPGQTATLTASAGFSNYDWTPMASGQSIPITSGGNYVVTATDGNGCTAVAPFTATASQGPVASISTADPLVLCINPANSAMLNLVAQTGLNYNFAWYCNGGYQSQPPTQPTFKHTNNNVPGTFAYYVVVTDLSTGCTAQSNTITVIQQVCPPPPNPCTPAGSYTLDILTATPQTPNCNVISFDANASNVNSISWDFNDPGGNSNTGVLPDAVHNFSKAGCYLVGVTGLTPALPPDNFCTVGDTISVCVPLVADFSFSVNCLSLSVSDQSTYLPGEGPVSWSWDFGDMSPLGNTATATHLYITGGTYTVTLTVTNSDGCQSVISQQVTVAGLPSAAISYSPPVICIGQPVQFNGTNTGTSGIISWNWNFGDGSGNGAEDPAHSYLLAGPYTVMLTVSDAAGCTSVVMQTLNVNAPPAPGSISFSPGLSICAGGTVTLTAPAGASWSWTPAANTQTITVS